MRICVGVWSAHVFIGGPAHTHKATMEASQAHHRDEHQYSHSEENESVQDWSRRVQAMCVCGGGRGGKCGCGLLIDVRLAELDVSLCVDHAIVSSPFVRL